MNQRIYRAGCVDRGYIPDDIEKTRTLPFVLSTYSKDRHNTVLNQDKWNLDNYRKNPVVAYMHIVNSGIFTDPNPDYIIARTTSISTTGTGSNKRLVASAQFEDSEVNPLAEKIFRKLLFGSLSATSVGFLPVGQGKYGPGNEAQGRENETYYFEGQELLEWSIVNIGSNPEAGKRSVGSQPFGVQLYAARKMSAMSLMPSQVEKMSLSDAEALLEFWSIGGRTTDPEKAKKLLKERDERLRKVREENIKYGYPN